MQLGYQVAFLSTSLQRGRRVGSQFRVAHIPLAAASARETEASCLPVCARSLVVLGMPG